MDQADRQGHSDLVRPNVIAIPTVLYREASRYNCIHGQEDHFHLLAFKGFAAAKPRNLWY